jgi:MobA/MobL family
VQEFIGQELGDKHAYQFAIHTQKAALEKDDQPHAHIMYSERIRDGIARDPEHYFKRYNAKNPEKGGAKKFSGGKSANELKAELLGLRERWAEVQNKHLEKHGLTSA